MKPNTTIVCNCNNVFYIFELPAKSSDINAHNVRLLAMTPERRRTIVKFAVVIIREIISVGDIQNENTARAKNR